MTDDALPTGLDEVRGQLLPDAPARGIGSLLGFRLIDAQEGRTTFAGSPGEAIVNSIGFVHGGFALALLDSAMGLAAQTTMLPGAKCTTLETKGNLVRAIPAGSKVRAEGRVISRSRSIVTAEATVFDESDRILAHGTSTLFVIAPRF